MCESENIIIAIEKHPCLWDIYNTDYHNRDLKDLAWLQVCKEVISDWEVCLDKSNKCADLKKKWTNIRDYYRKDCQRNKNCPTGSAAKKYKKYIYSDMLHFLSPVFENRNSEGNYNTTDIENSQSDLQEDQRNFTTEEDHLTQPPPPEIKKQGKKRDVPTQILNILKQREISHKQTNIEEDDDTKFLLSFRSYLKKMNDQQKIDFKLGMLQLVKSINNNHPSSSCQSPFYFNNSPDCSTSVPSTSSVYYTTTPSSAATFVPSSSRLIINSVTNLPPVQSTGRRTQLQEEQRATDSGTAQFLVLRSGDIEDENITKYLKLNCN